MASQEGPMKTFTLFSAAALLILLAGCSTETPAPQKKAEEKPAEPVTGRQALQQMYIAARGWAADIQIVRLTSILLPEVKAEPGKAAAWQALFLSASQNKARSWTYSVVESEGNLHKGVFAGFDQSWSSSGEAKPFPMAAIKFDSDQAYQTALKKGAEYRSEEVVRRVGVFAGFDQSWSSSGEAKPFPMAAIKFDSDQAYQTALKKGAEYDKKN